MKKRTSPIRSARALDLATLATVTGGEGEKISTLKLKFTPEEVKI